MKNQLRSPLEILVEILIIFVTGAVRVFVLVGGLLYELYISLRIMAYTNPIGLIIALTVGGIILFFTAKHLFRSTIDVIKIMTIYIVIVVLLLTIFGGSVTLPEPTTTTTT